MFAIKFGLTAATFDAHIYREVVDIYILAGYFARKSIDSEDCVLYSESAKHRCSRTVPVYIISLLPIIIGMPRGLKQTSAVVAIGFDVQEPGPNTFTQTSVDLNLSPLDEEVFVVLAINLDPFSPDAVAATDTLVQSSLTTTSQTAVQSLSNSNCLSVAASTIRAAGFVDGGCAFQTIAGETPPATLDYIGIIATNDFFVQVQGTGNLTTKGVSGKLYGYRAKADSAIYSGLVQSEVLSA